MSDQSAEQSPAWSEKVSLEAAIVQGSDDAGTVSAYLKTLEAINRGCTGIVAFRWPTVTYPLYFRCGSSDIWSFKQVFLSRDYAFPLPYSPRRMLDLGAYVGYVSVYMAERYPGIEIIGLEPMPDNFRMLTLNTAAYSNIHILNAAVWGSSRRLTIAPNNAEDWGGHLAETSEQDAGVQALSIPDIMRRHNWSGADFIKCDIEGAEISVFAEARDCIRSMVACCAVETHDNAVPGSSSVVSGCFDPDVFLRTRLGEVDLFTRRNIDTASLPPPSIRLLRPAKGLRAIAMRNVPSASWAFYLFGGTSCQLHPASHMNDLPEISTVVDGNGQSQFETELSVRNPLGFAVRFLLEIRVPDSDTVIFRADRCVAAEEQVRWGQAIPPLHGQHRIALQTVMAQPGTTSHQALANWINPTLC